MRVDRTIAARLSGLSIRAAVLTAIVVGVVLPALVVLALDAHFARRSQEPVVQRNRAAVMALSAAMLAEPAWTMSEPALREAVARIRNEPSVCAVTVLDLQPGLLSGPIAEAACPSSATPVALEAPVLHEGQPIARLRLAFDGREIDRQLAERRHVMAWLVAAQMLFGIAVLAGVLSLRLLRPIDLLKRQAAGMAARNGDLPPTAWPRSDELGQLGQHLNSVHGQVRSLIEELEGKNQQLHRMAMFDHLTGLPNRTLLREMFVREAAASRRAGRPMALFFVDLDHFKAVNDTHGHAAGDELLVAVARRIRSALRESDVVCRMGGDEFLVMLPQIDSAEQVSAAAERVVAAVQRPQKLTSVGEQVRTGASVGIAMYPADGNDFDSLVRAADVAMYRSKDLGRGRASFHHADMDAALRERLALERELAEAIDQQQLVLHYQPVMDAREGRVVGCEALVRWQHPRRGLLAPDAFIAIAEETGLIRGLGRFVLESACAQLAAWRSEGRGALRMAVNVSALQLHDDNFAADVQQTMARHRIGPGRLMLELTESTLFADSEAAMRAIGTLREAGVLLAVDDFGTGYSSLAALKLVRPDRMKIDRSFIRDLPQSRGDAALVEAMLGMARALDIVVVAEGVETQAQSAWLLERGGHLQQGWLHARAMPPAQLGGWLDAHGAAGTAAAGVHNLSPV